MTQATVAGDIKQTLNVHLHFTAQCTFGFELIVDDVTNSSLLIIIPLIHFFIVADTSLIQDILGGRTSDTEDIGKTDFSSFVFGYIYTGYTGHMNEIVFLLNGLSLALLITGILFVDHKKHTLTAYDFAICTPFFDGSSYLHCSSL